MTMTTCPNCGAKNRVDERAAKLQAVCGKCGTKLNVESDVQDHPLVVTDDTFDQVISDTRPVLVDFWATWCPPCRAIAPVLEQLAADARGRYVIATLDVDANQQTAGRFGIEGIPTLLIFKNGALVDRMVGAHPRQTIEQHLRAHI